MQINPVTQLVELDNANPETVVIAPVGSTFYREGDIFYISTPVNPTPTRIEVSKKSLAYKLSTQAWYSSSPEYRFIYLNQYESWYKQSGNGSTGWIFTGNQPIVTNYTITLPQFELELQDSVYVTDYYHVVPCVGSVSYNSGSGVWSMYFQINNSGSTSLSVGPVSVLSSYGATIAYTQPSSSIATGSYSTFSVSVTRAGLVPSSSAVINIPNSTANANCQFSYILTY